MTKDNTSTTITQPLSKNAQKRAAKAAYLQEKKLERRKREKAVKKEKKRAQRERAAATRTGDEDAEDVDHINEPARKKVKPSGPVRTFKARVVIDLGFDSYMTDREVASMNSQLAFCYSANRHATCPFETLLFTSLSGRLRTRLEEQNNAGYKRWTSCEWWDEGYERLWRDESTTENTSEDDEVEVDKGKRSRSSKEAVVYLTADADDELEELRESETYILGGIVDRNRHKFLCQKKAKESGIRTARLPIGKYLAEMKTRKVLTVNQVFEILVHWTENRDWKAAIYSVMPKRKFIQPSNSGATQIDSKEAVGLEEVEGVEDDDEGASEPAIAEP
ncbi:uncharacterized protein FOMMEDRAFT_89981 [Fomitiporia mediterranea MF3/22]|uniref:uncharacterized protein n=1 Tax=Fomitiporia mediterranea (strain MF3/22) TaxID=694068 RepID=UPI0004407310|nr:uncharacterized protein FOMMEDRAFT_89981 [Fomitiporia mediterranea MF3/22]EJD01535.1 hypothetical protein FOMMEDRAFT_89981 [Fomitiporia mediterranea MF3/22]